MYSTTRFNFSNRTAILLHWACAGLPVVYVYSAAPLGALVAMQDTKTPYPGVHPLGKRSEVFHAHSAA
jgi:hypothetical protein